MKAWQFLAACLIAGIVQAQEAESWPDDARASTSELATTLQKALKGALANGNLPSGIQACNLQAIPITEAISSHRDIHLSRVSERTRNPANAPSEWQRDVLLSFKERVEKGEDIRTLEWVGQVQANGRIEYRYMKAIPTQEVCLRCHGESLAPDVAEIIRNLYPDDQATGYKTGELRGAFVAVSSK